jgi:sensor histidine kinase YesM
LISVVILIISVNREWNAIVKSARDELDKTAGYINGELEYILRSSNYIVSNFYIKESLDSDLQKDIGKNMNFYHMLEMNFTNYSDSKTNYILYSDNPSLIENAYLQDLSRITDEDFKESVLQFESPRIFWKFEDSGISFYRNIPFLKRYKCILKATVQLNKIEYFLNNANINYALVSLEERSFYGNPIDGSPIIASISSPLNNGMKIYAHIPAAVRGAVINRYTAVWAALLGVFICSVLTVSNMAIRGMNKKLDAFVMEINRNDLLLETDKIKISEFDELVSIKKRICDLLSQINEIHQENMAVKLKKQSLEMELLQSRINPHLLYNTLSVFKWNAMINKNSELAKIISELADFYRAALNQGLSVTSLRHELRFVNSYMNIVRFAHSRDYKFITDIPPDLLDVPIISHITQPLIENAVLHGVSHNPNAVIELSATAENGYIILKIKDNGHGMSREKVEEVNSSNYMSKYKSYGLYNTKRRIQLYYSENCGLTVESEKNKGTAITVKIDIVDAEKIEEKFSTA